MPLLNRPAHSKATLGDRSFSFASSSVWNSIPNDVRCDPSLSSSKSRLKTYLFRSVYKDWTVSLITVHMCMVWSCYGFVDGVDVRMSILDTNVDGSIPSINMFPPWARDFIRIASVDSAVKWVPGGDNLMKGVQCYELFGGIALKIHTFSFLFFILKMH